MIIKKENPDILIKDEIAPYTTITTNKKGNKVIRVNRPSYYNLNLEYIENIPGLTFIRDQSDMIRRFATKNHVLEYKNKEELLIINDIISGHGQIAVGEDKYIPFKSNDILIHFAPSERNYISMYGKFHAIHLIIDRKRFFNNHISDEIKRIILGLYPTKEKEKTILIKNDDEILRIFSEMKNFQPDEIFLKRVHTNIKVSELLLYIYINKLTTKALEHKTYTDAQIRVVRKIKNHLSRDIASYISLEVLSISYGINLTTLKNCFRDMYGKPLYTWYREYKFHRAKELIKNTDLPISKIAHMIGYRSSSKFTKAFKKEMGVLPSSYRKK